MSVRLLIVDDAPFIREVVKQLLKATDIKVVGEAEDGVEAVDLALSLQPDVILMDIVLPKQSGIEATRIIKEQLPDINVLACSTIDNEAIVMKAIEAGCSSYITKPFKADELIASIRRLSERGEQHA